MINFGRVTVPCLLLVVAFAGLILGGAILDG